MALSIHDRTGVVHANDRLQRVAVANERVRTPIGASNWSDDDSAHFPNGTPAGFVSTLLRVRFCRICKSSWVSRGVEKHEKHERSRSRGPRIALLSGYESFWTARPGGWLERREVRGCESRLARSLVRDGAPLIHNVCGRLVRRRTKVEVGRMYGR